MAGSSTPTRYETIDDYGIQTRFTAVIKHQTKTNWQVEIRQQANFERTQEEVEQCKGSASLTGVQNYPANVMISDGKDTPLILQLISP